MTGERLCLGVVTGARGLRGEVRIKSFTHAPADVAAYGPLSDEAGRRTFRLRVVGEVKGQVLARIDGVADRTAAEALKGVRLYVERAALPVPDEDEYYHADLIGLRVEGTAGEEMGTVKTLFEHGAGDVMEIALARGGTLMVPFTRAAVPVVDLAGGRVVVDPPAELDGGGEG